MKQKKDQEPMFDQGIYYPDGADSSYDLYLENKRLGLYDDDEDELIGKLVTDILFVTEQFGLLKEIYANILKDFKPKEARIQWVKPDPKINLTRDCMIFKVRIIEHHEFGLFMPDDIKALTNWVKKYSKYGDIIENNGIMLIIRHAVDQDGKDVKKIPGVIGFYTLSHEIATSPYDSKWRNWLKKVIDGQCSNPDAFYGAMKEYEFKKGSVWSNPDYRPAKNEKIPISALKDDIPQYIYERLEKIMDVDKTIYYDRDIIKAIITLDEAYKNGKEKNATYYSFNGKTVNVCIPYSIFHENRVLCDILSEMLKGVGANDIMTFDAYESEVHVDYKLKLLSPKMGQLIYDLMCAPLV